MLRPTINVRRDRLDIARRATGLTSDAALAKAMGVHGTTVGRTLSGEQGFGRTFIAGLLRAFPSLSFEDLFTIDEEAAEGEDADADTPELVPA